MAAEFQKSLIPLLYVGDPDSPIVDRLREHGFGVIVADGPDRALRLLKHFRVAAVVDDVPALPPVPQLAACGTPVILLAAADADWGGPHVRVVRRDSSPAVLAELVHRFAIDTEAA